VLGNLLSNAIKFSDAYHSIEIIVSFETKISQHITFTVLDEGFGIPEEDQLSLFQAFKQVRPGEINAGRGSGLGLSICKSIVQMHNNGSIGFQSKCRINSDRQTGGSEFYFNIKYVPVSEFDDESYSVPNCNSNKSFENSSDKVEPKFFFEQSSSSKESCVLFDDPDFIPISGTRKFIGNKISIVNQEGSIKLPVRSNGQLSSKDNNKRSQGRENEMSYSFNNNISISSCKSNTSENFNIYDDFHHTVADISMTSSNKRKRDEDNLDMAADYEQKKIHRVLVCDGKTELFVC
jgi:hypothetical protein